MESFVPQPAGSGPQHIRVDTQVPAGGHSIKSEIVVHPGATLMIEPGTALHFEQGVGVTVLGTLTLAGRAGAPVELSGSGWSGLTIVGAAAKATRIEHALFSEGNGRAWNREFDAEGLPIFDRTSSHVGGACQLFDMAEGEVRFTHVIFADNHADDQGGAVHLEESSASFDHCTFRNNGAGQGGAVRVRGGTLTAAGCSFEANGDEGAPGPGGAIAATAARGQLTGCTFKGNAGDEGGALLLREAALTLRDCIFEANRAVDRGGALFAAGKALPILINCEFKANQAQAGGGAVTVAAEQMRPIRLQKCVFTENLAGSEGGALAIAAGGTAQLEECRFERNQAAPNHQTLAGGAIFCAAGARLALVGCQLTDNQAACGGAIATGVSAGSDEQAHAHLAVRGGAFLRNSATTRGGAICLFAGDTLDTSAECRFEENRAGNEGGAVHADSRSQLMMVSTSFKGNSATSGGALQWLGERGRLDSCRFEGNRAEVNGGALACLSPITVRNSHFGDNQALRGGAVWCPDGRTIVTACEFRANRVTGPDGGGAIHCSEADGTYQTDNNFSRNRPDDVAYRNLRYPGKSTAAARGHAARSCWVVTAYYGYPDHPAVCAVRTLRDDLLEHPIAGPAVARLDHWYRAAERTTCAAWWSAQVAGRRPCPARLLTAPVCQILFALARAHARGRARVDVSAGAPPFPRGESRARPRS
jgi:predicted outer membrane repeat protein